MSPDTKNSADTKNNEVKPANESSLYETGLSFCQIKELMAHMKKEGVTSFQMGEGKNSLSLMRDKEVVYLSGSSDTHMSFPGSAGQENYPAAAAESAKDEDVPQGYIVTSPVVGVFYDSPAPDQEPYVSLGSYVKKGDVLCIIEAMKLMNEVNSPVSGRITEILVKKASRVEYGHKLFIIDPGQAGEATNE